MDWVGNRPHGVRLPHNYLAASDWHRVLADTGFCLFEWHERLAIYHPLASWLFDRRLQVLFTAGRTE